MDFWQKLLLSEKIGDLTDALEFIKGLIPSYILTKTYLPI